MTGGKSMNHELVAEGMAWWYRQYAPADRELERLEADATAGREGSWPQGEPIAPWDWRHGKGILATAELVGNRKCHVCHAPKCNSLGRMKEENRITFKTAADALAAGYRKAGDCR